VVWAHSQFKEELFIVGSIIRPTEQTASIHALCCLSVCYEKYNPPAHRLLITTVVYYTVDYMDTVEGELLPAGCGAADTPADVDSIQLLEGGGS